ncbi:MAG: response regulator [Brachymonas sp.]|nr:response regulator [Brachymonas sp.]
MPTSETSFTDAAVDVLIDVPAHPSEAVPVLDLQAEDQELHDAGHTEMPTTLAPDIDGLSEGATTDAAMHPDAQVRLAAEQSQDVDVFSAEEASPSPVPVASLDDVPALDVDDAGVFALEVDSGIFEDEPLAVPAASVGSDAAPEQEAGDNSEMLFAPEVDSGVFEDDPAGLTDAASPDPALKPASDENSEVLFAPEVDSGIFVDEVDLQAEVLKADAALPPDLGASLADPFLQPKDATPAKNVASPPSFASWDDIRALEAATAAGASVPVVAVPAAVVPSKPAVVTAVSPAPVPAPTKTAAPSPAKKPVTLPASVAGMIVSTGPQIAVLRDMADGLPEEEIKRIGELGIPLALFNAYLNEADAWSRQLVQQLEEWMLNFALPAPEAASHLAHSLAGSSAAVGMQALASLARGIEHAVDHLSNRSATANEAQLLLAAAQELRQDLHQFAAGIERPLDIAQIYKLGAIVDNTVNTEVPPEVLEADWGHGGLAEKKTVEIVLPAVDSAPAVADKPVNAEPVQMDTPQQHRPEQEAETHEQPADDQGEAEALFAESAIADVVIEGHDQVADAAAEDHPDTLLFGDEEDAAGAELSTSGSQLHTAVVASHAEVGASAAAALEEALDPELFEIFREEAEVLIPQLGTAMRQWEQRPTHEDTRKEIMRLLHTIKGGARLAGAMHLGTMAHDMETAIGDLGQVQSAEQLGPLQDMLDDINQHFAQLLRGETPAPAAPSQATAVAAPASATVTTKQVVHEAPAAVPQDAAIAVSQEAAQPKPGNAIAMPVVTDLSAQQKTVQAQVRVRANVLDRLLAQAGEVMTSRARMAGDVSQLRQAVSDMDGSLERLRAQLRDMEVQAESQMQSRQAQSEADVNFDPLEFDRFTRVQELTRLMAESVNDVASVQRNMLRTVQSTEDSLVAQSRQTKDLQDDLLRTRMVEFDSLSDRLYRVVRQAAKESDRQVKLDILGGTIEMDRNVIERIAPSFEHLLRNSVVHGIEDAEQRARVGKGPVGHIEITLLQEGNDVAITVRDDGRGLDVLRIRDKAIAQGLLQADARITDNEAAQLIFQSGLSTAEQITSLAGRGVGMDVVRADINALGGRVEVNTRQHFGTEFIMVLPLTTAVTQVVELRAGDLRFGVPSNLIDTVRRATPKEIEQAYNTQAYTVDGETLPFYWGGAMLQDSRSSENLATKRQVVVVVRSAAQRVVVHVDAVIGNHEVVVKNIGPQLARMPGLSGVTILPDGRMLFIYNPVALSFVYGDQIRTYTADRADPAVLGGEAGGAAHVTAPADVKPLVLVVDDSITVRRVTERLLKREGYRVALAADGLIALRELAAEKPAIVLSDIEMPQMDGFDLLRNIRDDANLKDLPVIMITSRTADKHREHAEELGATGFLGKPYPEEQLLELIRQHTQTGVVV